MLFDKTSSKLDYKNDLHKHKVKKKNFCLSTLCDGDPAVRNF